MISGVSKPVPAMSVTDAQREVLESLARSQSGPHREVVRAKALLMAADGASNATIAARLSVSRSTVANWRTRFTEDGLVKFGQVREGRGRKSSIPDATIEKIVTLTKEYRPEGETHWSTRTMAGVAGVSKSTVQRVWKELGLKPHRVDTFKVSGDPKFDEKLVDVVGLYLNPPENAIVLCADEKSSVQALDRTQASLPIPGSRPPPPSRQRSPSSPRSSSLSPSAATRCRPVSSSAARLANSAEPSKGATVRTVFHKVHRLR